jgi:PAS domain-containing protein
MSFFLHEDRVSPQSLRSIDTHDHVAIVYESQQNKADVLAELCRIGLERNELCLFATNEGDEIESLLRRRSIDVDSERAKGSLVFEDVADIFPKERGFDPNQTISLFESKIHNALDQGFTGLRVFNTTYTPAEFIDTDMHLDFVSRMSALMAERNVIRISLFDLNVQEPDVVINAILGHPIIVLRGIVCNNFFYVPPDHLFSPKGGSPEMYRLMDNLIDVHAKELTLKESRDELESVNALLRDEIQKRRMVEWALLISELRYRNTLDSLNEPVYVVDRDYRVIIANRALEGLGDRMGNDFRCVGRTVKEAFPFFCKEELDEYMAVFDKGQTIVSQRVYELAKGKVWAEVSKVPIMDGDRVANVTTIIRRINESERATWN